MLVTLDEAIAHLRVEAGPEDNLITLYALAAEQSAMDYLNRQVFADQDVLEDAATVGGAGANPLVVNYAIKAAILLTLGHLYANREDVVAGQTVAQLPFGARSLLRPHRIVNGF
ncbi:phage gp6-like head-tail connector protein [Diaphorobacter sp. HDW4B]|uniref:head-tail connector protein n=1 Tax=Diaphorobacter sp. HDW4B TaxID=2714925 RepID=UPI00140B06B8|nr:head-tail connector protein [Diaphorobacter sp. HDW4B]QIL69568.1 phage gp6-like head-tail connector protein [Diaphorobacter sp. HDW4B]QIL72318.1 phage gp6-like head-tail connector protein [Diaphorobacter sp. HDW4B]